MDRPLHIAIIIPFFNEAHFLAQCLDSFVKQSQRPDQLILVNDNSSDDSPVLAEAYTQKYDWIRLVHHESSEEHMPGEKVINAFWYGVRYLKPDYDLIGKFDADILLPKDYFSGLSPFFTKNQNLGLASGLLYIKKNAQWQYESIADKTHVRGPIKLYSKGCFEAIGGPRAAIGWDTLDTLLAKYHGFETQTHSELIVKHLRPTGGAYTQKSRLMQGHAMYTLGYGFWISLIASAKTAIRSKKLAALTDNLAGFFHAKKTKTPFLVTTEEARFIRKTRWRGILNKLGL
jgi:glycosyltransferase involved in cell wall biosynthesis